MGLLGDFSSISPLGAAEGLLAASGYSRVPITNGQVLASGLAGGQNFAKNAALIKAAQMKNEMLGARIKLYTTVLPAILKDMEGSKSKGTPAHMEYGVSPATGGSSLSGGVQAGGLQPTEHWVPGTPATQGGGTSLNGLEQLGLLSPFIGVNEAPMVGNIMKYNPGLQAQIAQAKALGTNPLVIDRLLSQSPDQRLAEEANIAGLFKSNMLSRSSWNAALSGFMPTPGGGFIPFAQLPKSGIQVFGNHEAPIPGAPSTEAALEHGRALGEGVARAQTTPISVVNPLGNKVAKPLSTVLFPHGVPTFGGGANFMTPFAIPGSRAAQGGGSPLPSSGFRRPGRITSPSAQGAAAPVVPAPPVTHVAGTQEPDFAGGPMVDTQNNGLGGGNITEMGPGQKVAFEDSAEARQKWYAETKTDATDAQENNLTIDSTIPIVKTLPTGVWSQGHMQVLNYINSMLPKNMQVHEDTLNGLQIAQKNLLHIFMDGMRSGIKGQEKASMFTMFKGAFPSIAMQKGSLGFLLSSEQGLNNYNIARHAAASAYMNLHKNLIGFQASWLQNQNPLSYAYASMIHNGYTGQADKLVAGMNGAQIAPLLKGMFTAQKTYSALGEGDMASAYGTYAQQLVASLTPEQAYQLKQALTTEEHNR